MNKKYKAPTMKVITVHCSHMLCGSEGSDNKPYVRVNINQQVIWKTDGEPTPPGYGIAW